MHVGQSCNVVVRAAADDVEFDVPYTDLDAEDNTAPDCGDCLNAGIEYVEEVGLLEEKERTAAPPEPVLVTKVLLVALRAVEADEVNEDTE